jgi:alpha-amylase
VELRHLDGPPVDARFGIEWTLTMLGGGGNPAAWWDVDGVRTAHDVGGTATDLVHVGQGNDYIGVAVNTTVDVVADAWWAPVETVSNSENGFERVYQGSGLLLSWPLALGPGDVVRRTVRHAVTTDHDRTAEGS